MIAYPCEDNLWKDGKDGKERWLDHHKLRASSEIKASMMIQLLSAVRVTVSEHADMLDSTLRLIACECSVNNRAGLSSHRDSDSGTMIVAFFVVTLLYVPQPDPSHRARPSIVRCVQRMRSGED